MTIALWICFALSGAAALALEMLWMRSAGLVVGQTAATAATVLACYFAGLGLGAAAARAQSRRGRCAPTGGCELGAALGALWSLAVFHVLAGDGAQRWLALGGAAGCGCRGRARDPARRRSASARRCRRSARRSRAGRATGARRGSTR